MHHGVAPAIASTHGYVLALRIGAVLLVVGGVLVSVLLEHVTAEVRAPVAELATEPV
jgi:hypothetical protein